jgi:putative transposase
MPSRNILKEFAPSEHYHVYNRGVEKRVIFLDDNDYAVFLGLLKKYLTGDKHNTENRHIFENLNGQVRLLAYCLMPNHFHLLLYQTTQDGVTKLMRRVITGYVMYFNNRYQRVGSLFQGRYKASRINADDYLHHISRYIHLNPDNYTEWPYSSLPYYLGKKESSWVQPKQILELFDNNTQTYIEFLRDYEESKKELSVLKWQLANDPDDM